MLATLSPLSHWREKEKKWEVTSWALRASEPFYFHARRHRRRQRTGPVWSGHAESDTQVTAGRRRRPHRSCVTHQLSLIVQIQESAPHNKIAHRFGLIQRPFKGHNPFKDSRGTDFRHKKTHYFCFCLYLVHCKKRILNSDATKVKSLIWKEFQNKLVTEFQTFWFL